jgi:hypothetical protein
MKDVPKGGEMARLILFSLLHAAGKTLQFFPP